MLRILTFNGVYLPGYKAGGPIRSLDNMVAYLNDEVEFYIVTRDRDEGDEEPYPNININEWNKREQEHVYYQSEKDFSIFSLKNVINSEKFDGVLLNGFFSEYTIRYLLLKKLNLIENIPAIIMPRGDLASGALSLKKWKKKLFIEIIKKVNLYKGLNWLATSTAEKNDINKFFSNSEITVISNFPTKNIINYDYYNTKEKNKLKIIFISRITEVKNLLFALKILNEINGEIEFSIYGPISDNTYWEKCKNFIATMNDNIKIKYYGSIQHNKVDNVLKKNNLLFLPTLGENYGHVIVEALSNSIPVMISDKTPWVDLESKNAGWDISLNKKEKFREEIQKLVFLNKEEYKKYIDGVRNYVNEIFKPEEITKKYLNLFKKVYK